MIHVAMGSPSNDKLLGATKTTSLLRWSWIEPNNPNPRLSDMIPSASSNYINEPSPKKPNPNFTMQPLEMMEKTQDIPSALQSLLFLLG